MEPKYIFIISDWGENNPSVLKLKVQLEELFALSRVFLLSQKIQAHFPLESIYPVRKTLMAFPDSVLIINLCAIYREGADLLCMQRIGNQHVLSLHSIAYELYWDRPAEVLVLPIQPFETASKLVDELLFFFRNIDSIKMEKTVQNRPDYKPRMTRSGIHCQILHIDAYSNIVSNLSRRTLESEVQNHPWELRISGHLFTYKPEAWHGTHDMERFCYFDSADLLKLAIKNGKLASNLGFLMGPESYMNSINIPIKIDYDN